jgi:hypothetical protein
MILSYVCDIWIKITKKNNIHHGLNIFFGYD